MQDVPENFGKYMLLERLASGGMAEVFLAKQVGAENVSKFVAIKRILPQHSTNADFVSMFKEEAKIAVNLSHSNIAAINEFGDEKGQFYLVMEYVEGRNLRQILNKIKKASQKFSFDQCVYIISEAAKGLDHAHRCIDGSTGQPLNIVHRDISPQNIMVTFEGEVLIVDFGIARAESKLETTRAGTLKGKFSYMSPEQSEGLPLDARTDIFSLGIILWELVSDERLFTSNNELNTLRKIKECQVPRLRQMDPTVPEELDTICLRALQKDQNLRYDSASDFQKDLSKFLNRHYPDFSQTDFATAMKELYLQEINEMRQKLVEYSKLKIDIPVVPSTLQLEPPLNVSIKTNTKKLIKNLENDGYPIEKSQLSHIGRPGEYSKSYNVRDEPSIFGTIINLVLLFGLGYGVYHYRNLIMDNLPFLKKQNNTVTNNQSSNTTTDDVARQLNAYPQTKLLVQSIPGYAEIYIDNQKVGITPQQIDVPLNKYFELKIVKPGHTLFQTRYIAETPGKSIKVELNQMATAQISINVIPGNAKVFIDGSEIVSSLPIKNYVVQANKELSIKAMDPISGRYTESKVTLKPNSSKDMTLYLNDNKRSMSSQ